MVCGDDVVNVVILVDTLSINDYPHVVNAHLRVAATLLASESQSPPLEEVHLAVAGRRCWARG